MAGINGHVPEAKKGRVPAGYDSVQVGNPKGIPRLEWFGDGARVDALLTPDAVVVLPVAGHSAHKCQARATQCDVGKRVEVAASAGNKRATIGNSDRADRARRQH